jgi:hypothetical protein
MSFSSMSVRAISAEIIPILPEKSFIAFAFQERFWATIHGRWQYCSTDTRCQPKR